MLNFLLVYGNNEQIKSLGERLERLKSYLNLEQKRIRIINEEKKTASPEFWNDPKEAEKP